MNDILAVHDELAARVRELRVQAVSMFDELEGLDKFIATKGTDNRPVPLMLDDKTDLVVTRNYLTDSHKLTKSILDKWAKN